MVPCIRPSREKTLSPAVPTYTTPHWIGIQRCAISGVKSVIYRRLCKDGLRAFGLFRCCFNPYLAKPGLSPQGGSRKLKGRRMRPSRYVPALPMPSIFLEVLCRLNQGGLTPSGTRGFTSPEPTLDLRPLGSKVFVLRPPRTARLFQEQRVPLFERHGVDMAFFCRIDLWCEE